MSDQSEIKRLTLQKYKCTGGAQSEKMVKFLLIRSENYSYLTGVGSDVLF